MSLLVFNNDTDDVWAHMECEKHKQADTGEMSSAKVTNFFTMSVFLWDNVTSVAEGAFAFHTVKHHSSYKPTDCTSVLFKTIFPDSEIAHKFSSMQTKTETIINWVISHYPIENIMQVFKNNSLTEELPQTQAITMLWKCPLL
jgi:hypothetical protein